MSPDSGMIFVVETYNLGMTLRHLLVWHEVRIAERQRYTDRAVLDEGNLTAALSATLIMLHARALPAGPHQEVAELRYQLRRSRAPPPGCSPPPPVRSATFPTGHTSSLRRQTPSTVSSPSSSESPTLRTCRQRSPLFARWCGKPPPPAQNYVLRSVKPAARSLQPIGAP